LISREGGNGSLCKKGFHVEGEKRIHVSSRGTEQVEERKSGTALRGKASLKFNSTGEEKTFN